MSTLLLLSHKKLQLFLLYKPTQKQFPVQRVVASLRMTAAFHSHLESFTLLLITLGVSSLSNWIS